MSNEHNFYNMNPFFYLGCQAVDRDMPTVQLLPFSASLQIPHLPDLQKRGNNSSWLECW